VKLNNHWFGIYINILGRTIRLIDSFEAYDKANTIKIAKYIKHIMEGSSEMKRKFYEIRKNNDIDNGEIFRFTIKNEQTPQNKNNSH